MSRMSQTDALKETKKMFGEDSFAEFDDDKKRRFYVGACPKLPGAYLGFMGFSWQEALDYAKKRFVRRKK